MVQTMESPPFDLYAYQPPHSLWKLIEEHVPDHEREEVKNMLGESLVDQSLELHDEINLLLDIWRDYREETTHMKPPVLLPEPRGLRERLVQEIQFFVENVKEKARGEGVNPEKILSRHNQDVLEYALEGSRPGSARPSSRMLTGRSLDGRETPMLTSPTCSDRMSAASTLSEEVEAMNDKLTVLKFDEVCQHLRQTLEEETETMKQDITFLQGCLDDEATFRAESQGVLSREPTLSDLREERTNLEKEMLSSMKTQTSPVVKPAFDPHAQMRKLVPPVTPDMKPKVCAVKPHNQTLPAPRPGPMKAFSSSSPSAQGLIGQGSNDSLHPHPPSSAHPHPPSPAHPHPPSSVHPQNPSSAGTKRHRVHGRDDAVFTSSGSSATSSLQITTRGSSSGERLLGSGGQRSTTVPKTDISSRCEDLLNDSTRNEETDVKSSPPPHHDSPNLSKSTIGAVVTLTKDIEGQGNTAQVHLIPSPPSSAKPGPAPARPSSAQRFRRMVLDCRD